MALPVITDCYRVTWNFHGTTGPSHNVTHFQSATGDELDLGADIDTALALLADESHLFWPRAASQIVNDVDILKLDGSSATVNYVLDVAQTGGASGNELRAVAGVVTLQTGFAGPSNRGRLYVGPAGDDTFGSSGFLSDAGAASCLAAWNTFIASMAGLGSPLQVASYAHSTCKSVTTVRINTYQGTMRKRAKFQQS